VVCRLYKEYFYRLLFIIRVKNAASKLCVNANLREMTKPNIFVVQNEHIQEFICVCARVCVCVCACVCVCGMMNRAMCSRYVKCNTC